MTAPNVGLPTDDQYDDASNLGDEEYDLSELDDDQTSDYSDDVETQGPPEGKPPAGEKPSPEGAPGTTPRDSQGRFARREAEAAPGAEGEAPPAGEAPPGGEEVREEAPRENPPFTFRGAKQDWTIEGSQVSEDWIHLPRKTFETEIRSLLADAIEHRTSFRPRLAEAQAVRQKSDAFLKQINADSYESAVAIVAHARTFQEKFADLVREGPEAIAEWLDGFQANLPKLQAAALAKTREKLVELAKQGKLTDEQPATEERESLEPLTEAHYEQLRREVPGIVRQLRDSDPELMKLISDEDLGVLAEDFAEIIERFVDRAPEDAPEYGLDRGDIYYDRALMTKRMRRFAKTIGARRVHANEAAEAAEANARRQGQGGRPAPPTVSARGKEAGRVEIPLLPARGNRAEYEEWEALPMDVQLASRDQAKRSTGKGIWPSKQKA
jgi:hypothetical protein